MKKGVLLVAILTTSMFFGQNTFPTDGNVGIGTTSPTEVLTIRRNIARIKLEGSTEPNDYYSTFEQLYSGTESFKLNTRAGGVSREILGRYANDLSIMATGGNVGIGTTSPTEVLTIRRNIARIKLEGSTEPNDYYSTFEQLYSGTESFKLNTKAGGVSREILGRYANDLSIMATGGNVGVGTTSPFAKLEIIGSTSNINGYTDGHIQVVGQDPIAFIGQSNLNPSLNRWGIRLRETGDGDFSIRDNTNNLTRLLIKSTGNVLIGTTTDNGVNKLQVNGTISGSKLKSEDQSPIYFGGSVSDLDASIYGSGLNKYLRFYTNGLERFRVESNGNVGIGTADPANKLHIIGDALKISINQTANDAGYYALLQAFHAPDTGLLSFVGAGGSGKVIGASNYGTDTSIYSDTTEKIRILSNGNVGIGTTTPDTKFTVNGTIHTKEVKVDLLSPMVPDYVFANDYKIKALKEVEEYIKKNNHLPEIPSAKEFEKNGLMLAEMNMSLLKKVEELTLYAIEQDKKINTKSNEIEGLKKDVEILKKDNEVIKVLAGRLAKMEGKLR
jgi:hypothetical protein